MEIFAPAIIGLGYLYIVSNQSKKKNTNSKEESFKNREYEGLPNVDVPNKNFPDETVGNAERDLTSYLSTNNAFDIGKGGVYTDKYFNQGMNSDTTTPEIKRDNKYISLTGQSVDIDYYRHNNMQPYFGSKSHTGGKIDALESTMDAYQGSGSQFISKKEIAPMFEPGTNLQYAFGTPNQTDFIRSRMNPSLKMSNVKPFDEIKVGPGLGLGYGEDGVGGFNSGMLARDLWRDKTVDELRVANKQKSSGLSSLGYEGPAYSSHRTERGNLGIQEKNRIDPSFELGQDRLFTTTGIAKGQTLRSIEIDRETARQNTSQEYAGVATTSNNLQYIKGEYEEPHRQSLGAYQVTPAVALNRGDANKNNVDSFQSYSNNRSYSNNDDYYGIVGSAIGTTIAPLLDILRPSRKENVIGTLRPYQNAKSSVEKSYLFNPNDVLPTTIRQTTENTKYHPNVDFNQHGGAYKTTPHQPVQNERDTTTDFFYAGVGSANERGRAARTYDAEYRQRNNDIKSSTIDGRLVPGNMALMNGDINVATNPTRDGLLQNNRAVTGLVNPQAPSLETFGKLQGSQQLFQGQQLERNNGDVLKQLKGNPYTLNVLNGL